jgi:hypothetical protein
MIRQAMMSMRRKGAGEIRDIGMLLLGCEQRIGSIFEKKVDRLTNFWSTLHKNYSMNSGFVALIRVANE